MKKTMAFAVKQSLPVMFGYLFLGTAFGLLLERAGYHFLWALAASIFVYAGSLQFVMVSFFTAGTPMLTVLVMSLLINSRHIFYGLSFIERFRGCGKLRYPYLIFSLTDETYSVLCAAKIPKDLKERDVLFWIALLDQIYWIAGSLLGGLAGQLLAFDTKGIDFAMTALFTVIFVEQWLEAKSHIPAVTGLVSAAVFLLLLGADGFLLPSLLVTVAILAFCRKSIGNGVETGEAGV